MPGPFLSRTVPPQPLCLTGEVNPETTLCGLCKEKNYTRAHCRGNKKHRQVPWNTVFVVLSFDPNGPTQYEEVTTFRKKQNRAKKRKVTTTDGGEDNEGGGEEPSKETKNRGSKSTEETINPLPAPSAPVPPLAPTSYFETIPRSRTFLCTASQTSVSVKVCVGMNFAKQQIVKIHCDSYHFICIILVAGL